MNRAATILMICVLGAGLVICQGCRKTEEPPKPPIPKPTGKAVKPAATKPAPTPKAGGPAGTIGISQTGQSASVRPVSHGCIGQA